MSNTGLFKDDERQNITGSNQKPSSPNSFTHVQKSLDFDGMMKQEDKVLKINRATPGQYHGAVNDAIRRCVDDEYYSGDYKCKYQAYQASSHETSYNIFENTSTF